MIHSILALLSAAMVAAAGVTGTADEVSGLTGATDGRTSSTGRRTLRHVREPLTLFDFDPHAMRGKHFFEGILHYRERILEANRHRILPREAYRCALCGGREGTTLLEWVEGYHVVRCHRCDYSTASFAIESAKTHVEDVYASDLYYEKFARETLAHFEYRKNRMGAERYRYVIERLGLDPQRARVLDVGCGAGLFLAYLKDRGVSARGLEVFPRAVRFCREMGLDVSDTDLRDEPDGAYDAIVMFDVLEHLDDPISTVSVAAKKLKPGGFLVGYTPNIHSVAYELMGSQQNTLLPFEHVGFFSDASFTYLAEHAGLRVYSVDVFGFDVMDYLLMKEYEDKIEYTVKLRDMMLLLQGAVDRLRIGNHFRVTFQRPVDV
ncbi:MAG: class I SAM-dependent methyltransferase [Gemmatimonadaceae bacterium]|nr:class I SAM-dependent methyltransferase [Gemmatimonadaceae bacterium]